MKAVIAESDVVTAYGWGIAPLWDGLMSGTTAITSAPRFSNGIAAGNKVAMVPGLVVEANSSRARAMLDRLLVPLIGKLDPATPILLATTVCEIEHVERAVLFDADLTADAAPTALLQHLKQLLHLTGSAMVMSSACASSAAALSRAAAMVERGLASAVLVVTCDAVSEFVYSGFSTLLSLCDTPAKPFDTNRCGLSLGEAAAWALVTRDDSPLADKNSICILGWSSSSDAVHMTAPDRTAGGLSRAIRAACRMANVRANQLSFIAAHGTATLYNDAMELLAFRSCIANPIPVFSVKGGTGHTLAAAGMVQILVAAQSIKSRTVPPTVGLAEPDAAAAGWVHSRAVEFAKLPFVLSTNSGFGGVNTAVILGLESRPLNPIAAKTSISSVGWIHGGKCGASGIHQRCEPINLSANEWIVSIIDRPLKYLPRMTSEARACLVAVRLAMQAAGWVDSGNVGIIGSGYDGCLAADRAYFRDYVASGRSLGRANLFIYTLPTSALSEVGIALNLQGPTLHACAGTQTIHAMVTQAESMVQLGEADGVLCVWSDGASAVCLAVGRARSNAEGFQLHATESPSDLCRRLAAMARES